MRAAVIEKFGEPHDVVAIQETERPKPGPGEVLVRMLAATINPSDLMMIRGQYGVKPTLPTTPGFEGVGMVEESGGGLYARFLVGKRVCAVHQSPGSWREWTVVPAKTAAPVPSALSIEQAAGFFVNPMTAYAMTARILDVPKDAWLVQTAAGSAVGRMVIRLGRERGFRTINIVRNKEQERELLALGASAVVCSADGDVANRVLQASGREPIRFALDSVGGEVGASVIEALGPGGRLLVYGSLADQPTSFSPRAMLTNDLRIDSFWLGRFMQSQSIFRKLGMLRRVGSLIKAGVLDSVIGATFPLEQVAAAVRAAEAPGKVGKILLKIADV